MGAGNGTKPRILVVDDEPRILRFVRLSLHALGFEVLMASTGEEALKLAEAEEPDVMVLDIFMPGMDGLEVLQRRRSFEVLHSHRKLPVIVFSARSSVADQAFKLGASDFISKPFLPEELAEKIRGLAGTHNHSK
jgi:two-component system KDP operon response regulator KdpE